MVKKKRFSLAREIYQEIRVEVLYEFQESGPDYLDVIGVGSKEVVTGMQVLFEVQTSAWPALQELVEKKSGISSVKKERGGVKGRLTAASKAPRFIS